MFANKRANRFKILMHNGIGIWLAARRLHEGKFVWASDSASHCSLERLQLDALVLGLPRQRVGLADVITVVCSSGPWAPLANWDMRHWRARCGFGSVVPMVLEQASLSNLSALKLREMAARLFTELPQQSPQ